VPLSTWRTLIETTFLELGGPRTGGLSDEVVALGEVRGPAGGRLCVAVPDVVGLSEAEAGARLRAAGLEPNVARGASSEPGGTVSGAESDRR
jgi:PASTA domain